MDRTLCAGPRGACVRSRMTRRLNQRRVYWTIVILHFNFSQILSTTRQASSAPYVLQMSNHKTLSSNTFIVPLVSQHHNALCVNQLLDVKAERTNTANSKLSIIWKTRLLIIRVSVGGRDCFKFYHSNRIYDAIKVKISGKILGFESISWIQCHTDVFYIWL